MYSRTFNPPESSSYFLFGPRGTGKSSWVKERYGENSTIINLLQSEIFQRLSAHPSRLREFIPSDPVGPVIIDEVQKIPALLDEVHLAIENQGVRFVLTGSSARGLKRVGVNLLAGRARTRFLYPLTSEELGGDFNLTFAIKHGMLPSVYIQEDPADYLASYVATYLKEEVQQEGLTRNLGAFSRFLEVASFSQACVLNISEVARECGINRKVAESYFNILEDLLLAERLPVFSRRAKRDLVSHPKFFFFDCGVFRTLRPAGPLDRPEEVAGAALETLLYQEMRAINDYHALGYKLFFWRTRGKLEVDFILYGERGLHAIEVKHSDRYRAKDSKSLRVFCEEYPVAKGYLVYMGNEVLYDQGIKILPFKTFLSEAKEILG